MHGRHLKNVYAHYFLEKKKEQDIKHTEQEKLIN